jgi:DNA-binding transcriptional regulator YhcF (GntR family)
MGENVYFKLEPHSGVPLGVQIAQQVRLAIASGRLAPGERLPSARDLAAELGVNFHTVRKAYGDLAQVGLLRFERGLGTFVSERSARLPEDDVRPLVRQHVERLLADLAGFGLSRREVVRLVTLELNQSLKYAKNEE